MDEDFVQYLFAAWSELIERFSVRSTPTCIVTRPGEEPQVFKGSSDIPQGIDRLIETLTPTSQSGRTEP